jgi:hypothetical protein
MLDPIRPVAVACGMNPRRSLLLPLRALLPLRTLLPLFLSLPLAATAALLPTSLSALDVSAVAPSNGPLAGGNVVIITGRGFATGSGTSGVRFGSIDLAPGDFAVDSDSQISAVVPAGSAVGLVAVHVTGQGSATLSSAYRYYTVSATSLQVQVSATIAAVLAIEWDDSTVTPKSWALGTLTPGAVVHTNSALTGGQAVDFAVRNVGNTPSRISADTAATVSAWSIASAPGGDAYALEVNPGANNSTEDWRSLSGSGAIIAASIASGATQGFDLRWRHPLWSTTAAAQAITVSITSSLP